MRGLFYFLLIAVLKQTRKAYTMRMDELTIGDKIYISSKRAAAITGYAKDYVGQLCREGHVEAKMVGRSWYVLETSIRAHRFGQPEQAPEVVPQEGTVKVASTPDANTSMPVTESGPTPVQEAPKDVWSGTWEAPTYSAEEAPAMPILIPEHAISDERETPQSLDMSEDRQSITEMQDAWKEWFESKQGPAVEEAPQEEPLAPEVIEEEAPGEVEEAVPVPVHRIHPPRPTPPERIVDMSPSRPIRPQAPVVVQRKEEAVIVRERRVRRRSSGPTNLVYTALMVAVAVIVIAIGVIGSGFADTYLGYNPIIEYLGGTSSVNK